MILSTVVWTDARWSSISAGNSRDWGGGIPTSKGEKNRTTTGKKEGKKCLAIDSRSVQPSAVSQCYHIEATSEGNGFLKFQISLSV